MRASAWQAVALTDRRSVAELRQARASLKEMEAHRAQQQQGTKQLTIGLFDSERIWALSTADVSATRGLVVRWLTVHPAALTQCELGLVRVWAVVPPPGPCRGKRLSVVATSHPEILLS